jgi:hypothetical protein
VALLTSLYLDALVLGDMPVVSLFENVKEDGVSTCVAEVSATRDS